MQEALPKGSSRLLNHKSRLQAMETKENQGYRSPQAYWSVPWFSLDLLDLYPGFARWSHQAIPKDCQGVRTTNPGYRTLKPRKIKGTEHLRPGVLYPWFPLVPLSCTLVLHMKDHSGNRALQEKQGTGQITKVGYRTGVCHEKWTTGQVPGKSNESLCPYRDSSSRSQSCNVKTV